MMNNQIIKFLLTAVLGLITLSCWIGYLISIPLWQNPDEPTHLEYVLFLARERTGPTVRPASPSFQERIILSMDHHHFWDYIGWPRPQPLPTTFSKVPFFRFSGADSQIGRKPSLYYKLASLLPRLLPDRKITSYLYFLRSLSGLFSLGTIILIFFTSRLIFSDEYYFQLSSAAFAAFLPQFCIIGTSGSYESLACLSSAGFIYLLLNFQIRGFTMGKLALTVACLIFAILVTYRNIELLPLFFFSIAIYFIFLSPGPSKWWMYLLISVLSLIALWILFQALIWWAPFTARLMIIKLLKCWHNFSGLIRGSEHPASFYYPWFHTELFKSFWLKFGWAFFTMKQVYYHLLKVVSLVSLIGVIIFTVRAFRRKSAISLPTKRAFFTLIGAVIITLTGYYLYWGTGKMVSAQGRHLFVSLPAWAILFNLGFRELCPKRYRPILYIALISSLVILNAIALFGYILPTFR